MKKLLNCNCFAKWSGWGPTILRVVVGLTFFLHGWQKMQGGIDGVAGFLATLGIPAAGFFAYVVTYVEFLGGIALILGLFTHWAAKLLAIDMLVALFTVHIGNGFFVSEGGVELVLILLGALIAIMASGPGLCAIDNRKRASSPTTI